jgi:thiamine pyrophosphokinase
MTYSLVVGAAPLEGHRSFYAELLTGASFVVAADAAGEWCAALGRVPDVAAGDFDSAEAGAVMRLRGLGVEVVEYPCDKDDTDLDLATSLALEADAGPIVITAAFTRRLDHTLAALGTLVRAGAGASAREPGWRARVCAPGSPVDLDLAAAATLSVLAIGPVEGVTITGARWSLADASLPVLGGRGVSNRAVGGPVHVETATGTLVVLVQEEAAGTIY